MDGDIVRHARDSLLPRADLKAANINELIIQINGVMSQQYIAEEGLRTRYRAEHPTEVGGVYCSDGRMDLAVATRKKPGILQPFRGVGARCEMFWPAFSKRLDRMNETAARRGARTLFFAPYHYSASDTELGCLGWKFDKAAGRAHAERLSAKMQYVFGEQTTVILTKFETDRDILTLHGPGGDVSGESCIGLSHGDVRTVLRQAFPHMDDQTRWDLIPFVMGNAEQVDELTRRPRDLAGLHHCEQILAIGQSFDWLAQKNLALLVNDFDVNLDKAIVDMAGILEDNLSRRPGHVTFTIFTNIPFKRPGKDYRQAEVRARGLQEFAQEHIRHLRPKLWNSGRLHFLTGVTFEDSHELKVLDQGLIRPT